jgi:hypothetical protein
MKRSNPSFPREAEAFTNIDVPIQWAATKAAEVAAKFLPFVHCLTKNATVDVLLTWKPALEKVDETVYNEKTFPFSSILAADRMFANSRGYTRMDSFCDDWIPADDPYMNRTEFTIEQKEESRIVTVNKVRETIVCYSFLIDIGLIILLYISRSRRIPSAPVMRY